MALQERASVKVPATSANLGAGFDVLGLSLGFYDELSVEVITGTDLVVIDGHGFDSLPKDGTHLVMRSIRKGLEAMGEKVDGLLLRCQNQIPHARGMGSSSAAIVAGLALAKGLCTDGSDRMPTELMIDLAGRMEGHPDNIAPCILGGMTIAWIDDEGHHAVRSDVHPDIVPVVSIPNFKVKTETARGLLPIRIPHDDAVFNISRSSLMVYAMTQDPSKLFVASDDRMHQRQRADAMPATLRAVAALRRAGLAAVVSGAGPTVLTLANSQTANEVSGIVDSAGAKFETLTLAVDQGGVQAL
ncbi:MAG: hypothetical protein GM45_5995 [actinobacterium acAMD-5]|jgi:homoserine kinase|nr:MAG: hypothetical protein GM45_5995 [actinobacterium acAMD-5]